MSEMARVDKWVRLETLPERFPCDPKPTSLVRFHAPLQELMRKGVTKIKRLFAEAKKLGYTARSDIWSATLPT